jgi:hypothetical protein
MVCKIKRDLALKLNYHKIIFLPISWHLAEGYALMKNIATKALIVIMIAGLLIKVGKFFPSSASAIETILNQCAMNSQRVNNSSMSAAQAAEFFSNEMQKMDTRNCPPEFRVAFQNHINAWRDAAGAFAQNTPLNAFWKGLPRALSEIRHFLPHRSGTPRIQLAK